MKLYNSLTKEIEEFRPIKDGVISVYSCGPTVYERAHIGNLAAFIYADTLRRALAAAFPDAKIEHIMNITDVDDKTIKASQEKYPNLEPMEALKKLTRHYEELFMQDMTAVGVDTKAIKFVRATDYIPKIQNLIKKLLDTGVAYTADDGIYFSIAKYKKAGKTYGQLVEITAENTSESRINNDEYDKDNVHDFVLWKKQRPDEPAWGFEINGQNIAGRPGWHIECSAMSSGELSQPFDIHTGGVDLKFPHHENEIAQSTATENEKYLAKLFMHSEHILVDGKKMAKSANNFYTLEDIKNKGFDPLAFRLMVLQSHYQNQMHFSWENLGAAQNRLKDFRSLAALRWQKRQNVNDAPSFALLDVPKELQQLAENNLNLPQALARFSEVSSELEVLESNAEWPDEFEQMLGGIDRLLGLELTSLPDITRDQKDLITHREKARHANDWNKADQLRAELEKQGIGLRDTPQGAVWYRL